MILCRFSGLFVRCALFITDVTKYALLFAVLLQLLCKQQFKLFAVGIPSIMGIKQTRFRFGFWLAECLSFANAIIALNSQALCFSQLHAKFIV